MHQTFVTCSILERMSSVVFPTMNISISLQYSCSRHDDARNCTSKLSLQCVQHFYWPTRISTGILFSPNHRKQTSLCVAILKADRRTTCSCDSSDYLYVNFSFEWYFPSERNMDIWDCSPIHQSSRIKIPVLNTTREAFKLALNTGSWSHYRTNKRLLRFAAEE